MELAIERLLEAEQTDRAGNRQVLESDWWYVVREVVVRWPVITFEGQWDLLALIKIKTTLGA